MSVSNEKWKKIKEKMRGLGINEAEIFEKYCLGSGSGGQKINKTNSTVQLRYQDISIDYGKKRSREDNRYFARKELLERMERKLGIKTKEIVAIEKKIKQKKRRKKKSVEKNKMNINNKNTI